ncbi:MAG: type II toxin-antitoxin system PemK/MazF family toxin [Opitutales bacterium]
MPIEPGEVYRVDLGYAGKVRLMVVVSRSDPDPPRALVLCAPITTQYRESDYEIPIGKPKFLRETSFVNLQGIVAIQFKELQRRVGKLDPRNFEEIREGIRFTFDL